MVGPEVSPLSLTGKTKLEKGPKGDIAITQCGSVAFVRTVAGEMANQTIDRLPAGFLHKEVPLYVIKRIGTFKAIKSPASLSTNVSEPAEGRSEGGAQ
jgi:hypothetical protein